MSTPRSAPTPSPGGLDSVLLTDLYQLTMLAAYEELGLRDEAVFEFFVRTLPAGRNFLVAAGLEQALDYLEGLQFAAGDIDWLASTGRFSQSFVDGLAKFHFTGSVHALPEGTVFFANEPVLRVTAPLPEAQLAESRLVNLLHFQALVASKAARCVLAAPGRSLVDFGMRRAHGAEAALLAARATWIAGFAATATVEAGRRWGIPLSGTMAHSFVLAHDDEAVAFEAFARCHPAYTTLLIDTYDTERGAVRAADVASKLRAEGIQVRGVRLDSGDLLALSKSVRAILDSRGLSDLQVFASGNLDEAEIARLVAGGAPIDGFGVGTRLDVSSDAPYLDCAYKLQEYAGIPRRKRSTGKATWPGRKQVFRERDAGGRMLHDTVGLETEAIAGTPLLVEVVRGGRRVVPQEPLSSARERCARELASLPDALRSLGPAAPYPVGMSGGVNEMAARADARTA